MGEAMYDQSTFSQTSYRDVGTVQGQVPRELERQAASIEELHLVISELEARTQAARLPKPAKDGPGANPEAVRAALAGEIASRTDSIISATERLQVILGELEL